MTRVHRRCAQVGAIAIALIASANVVLPSTATAMRGSGALAPRLAKLAMPSLRDEPPTTQARALGLSVDGLARQGRRVLVNVRFGGGALAARMSLANIGASPVAASRRYQTVTISVLPRRLREVALLPRVEGVTPVLAPVSAATCPSGTIVSEGDAQLKAEVAREANPGVDGAGINVGILSDSFDQASKSGTGGPIATKAADDVQSADLPGVGNECGQATPVTVISEENNASDASDEGRAMTQIVHDLAPGADLGFASAFNGEISFANNIRALATAGANVIVDDVFYLEEPFFQDGPVAVAVKEVVEDGVAYFSAAGNDNLIDEEGHNIASWETSQYRDAGSCPPAVEAVSGLNAFHCLDFNPGGEVDKTFGIKVEAGKTLAVDLQWDEPWNGVSTDLDAFLLNASAARVAEVHEDNVVITQTPVEVLEWTNSSSSTKTVQLVVNRFSGGTPTVKFALIQNGGGVEATEYPRSSGEDVVGPTIFGHSGSAAAISLGAVRFDGGTGLELEPEPYSSRGPVRHDFGPVDGGSPAPPLGPAEMLSKPDLVATDCGKTTFFAFLSGGFWRFCGTSAAAPHAAAVAALMLDAEPAAEPEDVRTALYGSAADVGISGPCAVGAGLVEAVGAIEKVIAKTGGTGPLCEPPASEVAPAEAAAPGNWGSEVSAVTPTATTPPPAYTPAPETLPATPPRTFFLQRPSKIVQTLHRRARVVFRFGSNEADVSFVCRIDGGLFRPCPERLTRRFPLGWHTLEVAARTAAGIGDRSPAHYRFKVKRAR
jgi:Subtilase family